MRTYDLRQTIFHPTRLDSTIDNIFTNVTNYTVEQVAGSISDHEPQLFKIPISSLICEKPALYRRRFTNSEKMNFLNSLNNETWLEVYAEDNPRAMFTKFLEIYLFHYNCCIPLRSTTCNTPKLKVYPPHLVQYRETLNLIKETSMQYPHDETLKNMFRSYKTFYLQQCEEYDKISNQVSIRTATNKPKAIWKKKSMRSLVGASRLPPVRRSLPVMSSMTTSQHRLKHFTKR